jgi:hypothetical protein
MVIRANSTPRYYGRFAVIALVGIGFALWFLYDGAIAWPRQRERGLAYKELMDNEELTGEERTRRWHEITNQKGWPLEYPGEPKTEDEITMQFIMATLSGLVGLWFLSLWLRSRGRWIEATETGITTSRGENVPFSDIEQLNKRKWRNKGIAKATYMQNGRRRTLLIDDFLYERKPTDEILSLVESRIGANKIVGGPPEPVLEQTPNE